jgi:hypothetical protein
MRNEVRLSDCGTYVLVRPTETTKWRNIVEYLSEAVKTAKANSVKTYLIDVRDVASGFSTLEHYQIAHHEGRKLGFATGSQIALLVSVGDRSRDFVVTVVKNAGFDCKLFEEESAAKDWLGIRAGHETPKK